MAPLLIEISHRLTMALEGLAAGDDFPPGQRNRLEGMLEAAVLERLATPASLDETLEALFLRIRGVSIAETLGEDWREFHPFPELPLYMNRAPVVPTTND
ncbi:MAG: hypothetical protein AAGG55_12965 [Pseudomonadota bacterium]